MKPRLTDIRNASQPRPAPAGSPTHEVSGCKMIVVDGWRACVVIFDVSRA